ncbi:MAG: tetratricopeptide repeat protein [Planctomycetota bacterium]|jgi:TolA-binding protein
MLKDSAKDPRPGIIPKVDKNKARLFTILLATLSFHMGLVCAEYEDNSNSATLQFDFANGLYVREMYELAVIEYNEFIARFPDDPRLGDAIFYLGESYLKGRMVTEAVKAFDRYLTLFPNGEQTALIYYRKGRIEFSESNFNASAELFTKALAAKPGDDIPAKMRYYLGKSYVKIGKYERAIDTLKDISDRKSPLYPASLLDLATAYEKTNQLPKSINPLKIFVDEFPESEIVPSVRLRLSTNLITLEKYEDAIPQLRAILGNPSTSEIREKAYYQLCWCYSDMKDFKKVLSTAAKFIELFPESDYITEVIFLQAGASFETKNYKDSLVFYKKVIDSNDSEKCSAESYYRAGVILAMEDNYTDSVDYFETFIERYKAHKMINYTHVKLGEIYEKLKNYNAAIKHYSAYTEVLPDGEYVEYSTFHTALCCFYLRKYESMASTFLEFAERYPESLRIGEALYYLGWDFQRNDDFENAILYFEKAFSGNKNLETSLAEDISYRLAICYYATKKFDKAANGLYEIIENNIQKTIPENILLWLGQYTADNSEYEKAINTYNTLLVENQDSEWTERCLYRLGEWYAKLNKWEESITQYKRLIQTFSKTELISFARLGIAEANRNLGKLEEAQRLYEELAKDKVTMVSARANMGMGNIYRTNGRYEDAVRAFMYVAILFDDADLCSRALQETSECWLLLNNKGKAVKVLEELISRYPDGPLIEDVRKKLREIQ